MNRRDLFVWIGLLIVTTVGVTVWIILSTPSAAQVTAASQALPPLSLTTISEQTFSELSNRETNGSLPVSPAPTSSTRTDPFR
jgi:hypothetical protein